MSISQEINILASDLGFHDATSAMPSQTDPIFRGLSIDFLVPQLHFEEKPKAEVETYISPTCPSSTGHY